MHISDIDAIAAWVEAVQADSARTATPSGLVPAWDILDDAEDGPVVVITFAPAN